MAYIPLDEQIKLPQVKSVHLDFDDKFIRQALQKRSKKELKNLQWPEMIKRLYKQAQETEAKLCHIESCCRKAREEQLRPYMQMLEAMFIRKTDRDYIGNF